MIASAQMVAIDQPPLTLPTIWGMDPLRLHDLFWASRGVCVVRPGRDAELAESAELYMLMDSGSLMLRRLRPLVETLSWVKPTILFARLQGTRDCEYRETVLTCGEEDRFIGVRREYRGVPGRLARVALTRDPGVAEWWQEEQDSPDLWRRFRHGTRKVRREFQSCTAGLYDARDPNDLAKFSLDLVEYWQRPDSVLWDIVELKPRVWSPRGIALDPSITFVGAAWIGSGRAVRSGATVLGPAILWDNPEARPARQHTGLQWHDIEPTKLAPQEISANRPGLGRRHPASKRIFDIVFSLIVIALTMPLYPLIMLAIWLEDGWPFFFSHTRETIGGREFGCLKFRSMRRDAEAIKERLQSKNQADGPQFFIHDDPRLTRVGALLRRSNLDELPQFFNVLAGHMSVVGPRPSPYKENQFCPSWREVRLSVRPGITGLWQIRRTRRRGSDFQEWIKYDLEYVQKWGWKMELMIIFKTVRIFIGG